MIELTEPEQQLMIKLLEMVQRDKLKSYRDDNGAKLVASELKLKILVLPPPPIR
jgi:hypothetical protein